MTMPYQSTWNNPYLTTPNAYQGIPQPTTYPMTPTNGIVKVNGRDSAMQYNLPPNSMSPALFDNNGRTFYIVSTDGTGTKTIEAFDFSPHVEKQPVMENQYVSRQEFEDVITKLKEAIDGVHEPIRPTTNAD